MAKYFGASREISRGILPVNLYTQWVWKIDLHNLLHFLRLRMDTHAQYEIREYANAIAKIVQDWVPLTWEAFQDYKVHNKNFSRLELQALRALFNGSDMKLACKTAKLKGREKEEFKKKVEFLEV